MDRRPRRGQVDHLKVDRRELAEGPLATASVVLGIDPGERQAELLAVSSSEM